MLILFLLFFLILLLALLFTIFKIVKWTLKENVRVKWVISISLILIFGFAIKKIFFTPMEFIQSNVYSNLYIVKNPIKEKEKVREAILNKIKEHLITQHKQSKKLSYSNETDCIYFYEYVGMSFGFLSEAGTEYFIDHEEDLGGFVTEELGMYQEYIMAEFYYKLPEKKPNEICGELSFFQEGEFIKSDSICNLQIIALN